MKWAVFWPPFLFRVLCDNIHKVAEIGNPEGSLRAAVVGVLLPILLFVLVAAAVSCAMIAAPRLLAPRKRTAVKEMPYESGMDPIHDARRRFDVRFHLVAIAFLVFDVELLFLYPWAVRQRGNAAGHSMRRSAAAGSTSRGLVFGEAMVFILLVVVGFVYAWRKGVFQMAVELPENVVVSKLDELASWCRKNSLWPMPFATACCGIELMATGASKHDIARFGAEVLRFSPRQCDLMIVAGRVVMKMLPVLQRIWQQMHEPKWCISMGACASTGGVFDTYCVVQGIDRFIPVDMYVPGCPPRPEQLIQVDHRPARQDSARRDDRRARVRHAPRGSSRSERWSSCPACRRSTAPESGCVSQRNRSECHATMIARWLSESTKRLTALTTSIPGDLPTSANFAAQTRVVVPPSRSVRRAASSCKNERGFDLLVDVTCVDYLNYRDATDRFGLVYLLANTETNERLIVRTFLNEPDLTVPQRCRCGKGPTGWSAKCGTCSASASTAIPTCGGFCCPKNSRPFRCARTIRCKAAASGIISRCSRRDRHML